MSNKRKARYEFDRARNALIKDLEKFINTDVPRIKEELNEIALGIITQWYADYEPFVYRRKMSLKHAFKVTATPDEFAVDYSPEFMNDYSHNQENEIIFNNAFMSGFHGGSYGEGIPSSLLYWRSPVPYYKEWGHPASRSFSPYKQIEEETQMKIDREIQKLHDKAERHVNVMERNYNILKNRR